MKGGRGESGCDIYCELRPFVNRVALTPPFVIDAAHDDDLPALRWDPALGACIVHGARENRTKPLAVVNFSGTGMHQLLVMVISSISWLVKEVGPRRLSLWKFRPSMMRAFDESDAQNM
ncbi:hypothetical protein HGRIS_006723 [Hohenbuehelia grisea]|uniref:Uncharacterized protein n=1 Tax=Hohenbuehelia grisea TaxID=104357 RepID=A0ABR3JAD4_9AGAR